MEAKQNQNNQDLGINWEEDMMRSQYPLLSIKAANVGGSPVVIHNYPCPVCHVRHAVMVANTGVFQPCWECQKNGFRILKVPSKWWKFWEWKTDIYSIDNLVDVNAVLKTKKFK